MLAPRSLLLPPMAALALLGSACHRGGAASSGFERIDERAQREARITVRGDVDGQPVVVHATAPFDEGEARRFLLGLTEYKNEVRSDYALLTDALSRHLGPELMGRLEGSPHLQVPELPRTWYLLGGEWPGALLWRGPAGSTYHIVREPGDALVPRSTLRYSVHSITHHLIRRLGTSGPGLWPRWIEEGLAEWHRLHFARMKDGVWDGDAEVLARLVWQRPAVRERLMTWRNPVGTGWIDARFEPDWESDLLYKGALGAVLALDQELPGGAIGLFKDLAGAMPQTNGEALALIESRLGHAITAVGWMPSQDRTSLREGLLARARAGELPAVVALGHFPEDAPALAELLRGLISRTSSPDGVIAGVTGLRYLGDRRLLRRTLREVEASAGPDLRASLLRDNRWRMAVEYSRSGGQGAWYANSAPTIGYSGTGPGTATPSSKPSTSPTR